MLFGGLERAVLGSSEVKRVLDEIEKPGDSKFAKLSQEFLNSMKARRNSPGLFTVRRLAGHHYKNAFSGTYLNIPGETREVLKEGHSVIIPSHLSYADLAVLPKVLPELGINDNFYYMGGDNIVRKGSFRERVLRNAGAVMVKREKSDRDTGRLYYAVLNSYISFLLDRGNGIINFTGRGRSKSGKVEGFSSTTSKSLVYHAKYAIPVCITYDRIIEDREFALTPEEMRESGKPMSSVEVNVRNQVFGKVHINFGNPVNLLEYRGDVKNLQQEITRFERDISEKVRALATVTPTNLLATALCAFEDYEARISVKEVFQQAGTIMNASRENGVRITDSLDALMNREFKDQLTVAASVLHEIGAISYNEDRGTFIIAEPKLLEYYSNTIAPTLEMHNVYHRLAT
jgi:glycerol-3-phosphate O-acyltransferase